MRQIVMWSLIILVLFVVFIGLAFVGLTYLTPTPEALEETIAAQAEATEAEADPDLDYESAYEDSADAPGQTDSTQAAKSKKISKSDSLQAVIEVLTGDLFFSRVTVDSLNEELGKQEKLLTTYTSQVESLEDQIEKLKEKNVSIKDLAKTYETMKVADIRPILERVDDKTIIALYKNMGTRTKKNLIQALSDVRAAQITKKLAGS